MARYPGMQSTIFLHPLSEKILKNPPLIHGDYNNYCFGWTGEEKEKVKEMYQYLRNITSKILVNENKLTVEGSLEIGECPDIFLMNYFFMCSIRRAFVDFLYAVFNSFYKIDLFQDQADQFEINHRVPIKFFDWYTSFYPIERGKSMFFSKIDDYMTVKFFGTFAIKDKKLYITVPDYIMYNFVRLQFYAILLDTPYIEVIRILGYYFNNFKNEHKLSSKKLTFFVRGDSRREAIIKTWYNNHITRYTDIEESFENLENKNKGQKFNSHYLTFNNLILDNKIQDSIIKLEFLFTFFFVNFFLFSLVKDSPEAFFDQFYENYGFWIPAFSSFQSTLQLEAVWAFSDPFGYTLDIKDKNRWPFYGTSRDDFFFWYHTFFFSKNQRMNDLTYFEQVKKTYSSLVQVNIDQDTMRYTGREWARPPKQRFLFDNLRPLENDTEQYYPGHPEFLSKFVQKGDILLSNFFTFKNSNNFIEHQGVLLSPWKVILDTLVIRDFADKVAPSLLTTDLELSQDFLAAVSEDNF